MDPYPTTPACPPSLWLAPITPSRTLRPAPTNNPSSCRRSLPVLYTRIPNPSHKMITSQLGPLVRPAMSRRTVLMSRSRTQLPILPRELALGSRRWGSNPGTAATYQRGLKNQSKQSESPAVAQRAKAELADSKMKDMLLPGIFIAQPLSKINLSDLLPYQWQRFKNWFSNYAYRFSLVWASKPGVFKPAKLKLEPRSQLTQTALQLHRELNTAMAAGDLVALRRLCGYVLYSSFSNTVLRRRLNEKYIWSLQKVNSKPKVVSARLMQMPNDEKNLRHMVAVRIDSTQLLGKVDPATGKVKGEVNKVHHQAENLLMYRAINARTYEKGQWYAFGFVGDTTTQAWKEEMGRLDAMSKEAVKRYKNKLGKSD